MHLQIYPLDYSFVLDGIKLHIFQISRGTVSEVPSHSHGACNYELHYISSGSGPAEIANRNYKVETNTLYMTGPFIEHSQIPSEDSPLVEYCINLQAEKADGWDKSSLSNLFFSNPAWFGQDRQNLLSLLLQIFREFEEKRLGYMDQISALLAQCMIAVVRNYEKELQPKYCIHNSEKQKASPLSDKAILVEHYFLYDYEHLSLEELAEQLGFSVRQTQRFIFEHYGKTFREKKEESRMAAALLLLSTSTESITSISEKLGFASVEYFSSCFKKFHGRTPRDYRKSIHP